MEAKIKCPNCNRCIGCIVSTDSKNGILKTMLDLPKKLNEKENVFHKHLNIKNKFDNSFIKSLSQN